MEVGIVGIVLAVLCGLASFLVSRWLTRRSQRRKEEKMRAEVLASQSRQVRRAKERQARR
jgi:type II secretory pathway pseudopilin PulG